MENWIVVLSAKGFETQYFGRFMSLSKAKEFAKRLRQEFCEEYPEYNMCINIKELINPDSEDAF